MRSFLSVTAMVMYEKSCNHMPFYRQEADWKMKGVPLPRETAANWYNTCALEYFLPVYDRLHELLIGREIIHADETVVLLGNRKGRISNVFRIAGAQSAEQSVGIMGSKCLLTPTS